MKTIIAMAISALVLGSGCVSVSYPQNYRPQNDSTNSTFYACEQQSTGTVAGMRWNAYGGAAAVGSVTNTKMLYDCMSAHNYQLRKASTGEIWLQVLTSPLWIPLDMFGAGIGSDMRVGDVADE